MNNSLRLLAASCLVSISATQVLADSYQFHQRVLGIVPSQVWQPYEPLLSDWSDIGQLYGCTDWTPDIAAIEAGTSFVQTTNCKQDQERSVQARERDAVSGSVRKSGALETESRQVIAQDSRQAVGTKEEKVCLYSEKTPMSYWVFHSTTSSTYRPPYYNGAQLPIKMTGGNGGNNWTQFTDNGVTYTRGTYVKRDGDYRYYRICL